ncbi:Transcription factor TGA6 [Zea mays]|jgi:hypothetical protein|uniref:Transcription factor TGA6 n=1 Tax=Zea mays TaxID=4577 RepID=A0A1D6K116_MAIZE|nr:Transcription factor TGA6 [Zea mays]
MADASSRTDTSTVLDMDDKNQRVAPLFSICCILYVVFFMIDHP